MGKLRLGVQIRDFDLERVGFALVILDRERQQDANGYLRMSLNDLERLISALRAEEQVDLVAMDLGDDEPVAEAEEPARPHLPRADVVSLPWLSRGSAAEDPDVDPDPDPGTEVPTIEDAPRRFLRRRRQPGLV